MTDAAKALVGAPLFIVGAPRSGTTLLAAMVGSHSAFAVGPESQFFSKLSPQTLEECVADPLWPDRATQALLGLTLADQSVADLFGAEETDIADFLAQRTPSIKAMLEALTVPFAVRRGKPRWAEKTPNHILSLNSIRALWPDAAVVRIVRDPRDAALSTCKLPTFSSSFVANTLLWRSWQDQAVRFFEDDATAITLRYEDLVQDPAKQLRRVCEMVGVDYEPAMVDFASAAADVSSANETWKGQVSGALDPTRVYRWRDDLSEDEKHFASAINHEHLQRFGYERSEHVSKQTQRVFHLSSQFAERHEKALVDLTKNGTRWLPERDWRKADIVCEHPPYRRSRDPRFLARLAAGRWRLAQLKTV